MAKSPNKTQKTEASVKGFLNSLEDEQQRNDCLQLLSLMESITGSEAKMWGESIVGFGDYHYKYASGREGDFFLTGFSPRKANLSIYIMPGFDSYADQLEKLGKHKLGRSCLYVKKLDDVDRKILDEVVADSVNEMNRRYNF
jgi:hypothetical protein